MKLAILTPGWLPVPAVDGGAVEVLITDIIKGNEIEEKFEIDLYTITSKKLDNLSYDKTNIIQIKPNILTKIKCRIKNYINKLIKKDYAEFPYNSEIISRMKKKKYDYVLVENNIHLYRDVYYNTKNKYNIFFHIHNDIMKHDDILCHLVCKTAKKILAVSEYIKGTVENVDKNSNVEVLYNCVDLDVFSRKSIDVEKRKELINKYKIKDSDIVFMFTGRINKHKGLLELIRAFKEISYLPNAKLIIVGSSWFNIVDEDEYLTTIKIESEKIKDKVIFTGYIYPKDMPLIYSLADVIIVPSMWEEPFGVVALEAMAMELPLIITNSGGLPEVVDEKCALYVKKDEEIVTNLQNAIKYLVANEILIREMGLNGRKRLESIKLFHKKLYFKNVCEILLS